MDIRTPEYWEALYQDGTDGWEKGAPAPPLVSWLDAHAAPLGRAIVPGCGRGHEVLWLARLGHTVMGVDFAPTPIAIARAAAEHAGVADRTEFAQADVSALSARTDWDARFDLAVEHTCLCTFEPERRELYARSLASVVRTGGRLVALIYHHGREGGPPFSMTPDHARGLLQPWFELRHEHLASDSFKSRAGNETVMDFIRRGADA